MAKFICKTLNYHLLSNVYTTPNGNQYLFQLNVPTEVKDPEDIEFFRKVPGFEEIGIVEKIKSALSTKSEKKLSELTREDIKAMNRNAQVELIKKLKPDAKIPANEKGRIELIMSLLPKE